MPQFLQNVARTDFANVFTAAQTLPANGLVVGTTQLVASGGFVGVGTVTPVTELNVATSSSADPRGFMSSQYSDDTSGARIHLRKSRGTQDVPVVLVTGDTIGRIRFSGYDGSNYLQMGSIDVVSVGTIGSTRVPTNMVFYTATDAAPSVLTERMRINENGSLRIGAGTITGKLYVRNDSASYYGVAVINQFSSNALNINQSGQADAVSLTCSGFNAGINVVNTTTAVTSNSNAVGVIVTGTYQHSGGAGLGQGVNVAVTNNTGASGVLYGAIISATANTAGATAVGLSVTSASSGGANYSAVFNGGNVGIGTVIGASVPLEKLDIFTGNLSLSENSTGTPTHRRQFTIAPSFPVSTDSSFTARAILSVFQATAPTTPIEVLRMESTSAGLGFTCITGKTSVASTRFNPSEVFQVQGRTTFGINSAATGAAPGNNTTSPVVIFTDTNNGLRFVPSASTNTTALYDVSDASTRYAMSSYDGTNLLLDFDASKAGSSMRFRTAGGERVRLDSTGNIGFNTTNQFGSGVKVIGLANATTAPTANPTGGCVIYSTGGDLAVRSSGGKTITLTQQAGTGETVGFTAGGGTAVTDSSTFTGNVGSTAYQINDVVKALKNMGLLAA